MENLTYVDEDGNVLFTPDGYSEDIGFTIIQLAKNEEYEMLEAIAERLANREQVCENFEKKSNEIDKLYLEKCEEVNRQHQNIQTLSGEVLRLKDELQYYKRLKEIEVAE